MPTYFFDTCDAGRVVDLIGIDLPNDAKAHREAIRLTGALMNHEPEVLWGGRTFRTEVRSASGDRLFTIVARAHSHKRH